MRQEINKTFWDIGDTNLQRNYVHRCITIVGNDNKSDGGTERKPRKYFFTVENEKIYICKTMFLDTLHITDRSLRTIFEKIAKKNYILPDWRGSNKEKRTKIPVATLQSVKDHINIVPRVESHYVRHDTKREFFEKTLSITLLYKLYLKWLPEYNPEVQAATYRQYANVFNSFTIGFHKPKKDQCDSCVSFRNSSAEEKEKLAEKHQALIRNTTRGRELKASDKEMALKKENYNRVVVACFNYQKVLSVPKAETSVLYYKRKLSVYDFTINDFVHKNTFCYTYHEMIGNKGLN